MLVRQTKDGTTALIHQEQHALLSGILATAWRPALDPRLVAAITLHDNPWRQTDASVRTNEAGAPVDFVRYPASERLVFYAEGLTELEKVDPYIAYLVSLHYTSFSGIDPEGSFLAGEANRRERLEPLVRHRTTMKTDLRWLQFFDVASLWLTLTGPDVDDEVLPVWLRNPRAFSQPPDDVVRSWTWRSRDIVELSPWPFGGSTLTLDVSQTVDGKREIRTLTLQDSAQSTTS